MISWNQPYYILLMLLIVVVIYLYWNLHQWRKKVRAQYADEDLQEDVFRSKISNRLNTKIIFMILSLIFLVLALMGPLWGEEEQRLKREGIDLVFALDLSNSMNAEDIVPSRLEKSKNLIINYIQKLGGDRIGLVVFAGNAYAVSPLTSDYMAITSFVESLNTNLLWDQGTNISAALQESATMLGDAPDTSKAIVLISDGEDHEKNVSDALEMVKDNHIEIFAIGVGNDIPVPIPMVTVDGWDDGYKKDDNGSTVLTSFHGEMMRDLAESTGGSYIKLERVETTLNSLKAGINSLEKKSQSEIASFNKKQQFQWFLGVAILFFFIYSLTPDNKKIKR